MIEQGSMPSDPLFEVVKVCASLSHVKQEVLRNYEDNQWWPLSIADWRLRLIVPGWSTRVSYNMISTYQDVVNRAHILGYDQLCAMSDEEIACVIAPIGLVHSRLGYFRSVQHFLAQSGMGKKTLVEAENDELIELFAKQVKGAGYKVAQCAMLYAKGYHCGICPVDSGMKDMLGPCLGMELPKGSLAHDVMRKVIEHLLNARPEDYNMLAHRLGYEHLNLPKGSAPTWWVHLVLIYFKRQYCNMHVPHACPLRVNQNIGMYIGTMCDRRHSQRGTLLKVDSPSLY